jgi:type I restriction enzyme, S subunit
MLPVALTTSHLVVNQDVKAFYSSEPAMNEWLAWSLRADEQYILSEHRRDGTTVQSIQYERLKNHPLRIPPLAEQQRIVEAIEASLARVTAARERLARVPAILKRFRQSVLAAACSGRLTADWREEQSDLESAAVLLERIRAERKAKEGKKYLELVEIDANDIPELPETWRYGRLGEVLDSLKYGTAQKCDYDVKANPVLRIPNIGDGVIDHSDIKYAALSQDEHESLKLRTGDLLMVRSNGSVSLIGKTALVRDFEKDFAYVGYLMRLRVALSVL